MADASSSKDAVSTADKHAAGGYVAAAAQLILLIITVIPLLVPVPTNVNIVLTASLCVFVGSWRSVKSTPPSESMSKKVRASRAWQKFPYDDNKQSPTNLYYCVSQDALKFPLIGSAVLVGLFCLFKFLPKDLVNAVLTAYFVLLGTFAITAAMLPFIDAVVPKRLRERSFEYKQFSMPYFCKVWGCMDGHCVAYVQCFTDGCRMRCSCCRRSPLIFRPQSQNA